jgi:hypothetical protein
MPSRGPSFSLDRCQQYYARLEIISDVVSERHVAEKLRFHIGNTDTTSVFSDTTSEIISNRVRQKL